MEKCKTKNPAMQYEKLNLVKKGKANTVED